MNFCDLGDGFQDSGGFLSLAARGSSPAMHLIMFILRAGEDTRGPGEVPALSHRVPVALVIIVKTAGPAAGLP